MTTLEQLYCLLGPSIIPFGQQQTCQQLPINQPKIFPSLIDMEKSNAPVQSSDCASLVAAINALACVGPSSGGSHAPWLQGRNAPFPSAFTGFVPASRHIPDECFSDPCGRTQRLCGNEATRCAPVLCPSRTSENSGASPPSSVPAEESELERYMRAFAELKRQVCQLSPRLLKDFKSTISRCSAGRSLTCVRCRTRNFGRDWRMLRPA